MRSQVAIDAPFLLLVTAVNIVQAIAYQLSSGSFIVVWASHLALALPYLLYAGEIDRAQQFLSTMTVL